MLSQPASRVESAPALRRVLRTYLDYLTVERGLAVNTLSSYRRDLERYLDVLTTAGVGDLAEVGPREVAAHLATLRAGDDEHLPLSAASAARAASAVRGLHRFAVREGLVGHDPAREVKPPALPRRLPKALDVTQVEQLLSAAAAGGSTDDSPLALRDRALLEFLYATGARISEAVGTSVDDLDVDEGTVLLHGKGGKARLVPVGGYARDAVGAYLVRGRPALMAGGRGRSGPVAGGARALVGGRNAVFVNVRGGRLSRQSAWTILRRTAQRAGLPVDGAHGVSPHTLRHSYATHLLDGGADIRVVQELLGHASVTTTQVYTLITVDRLREVYATAHPRARA